MIRVKLKVKWWHTYIWEAEFEISDFGIMILIHIQFFNHNFRFLGPLRAYVGTLQLYKTQQVVTGIL